MNKILIFKDEASVEGLADKICSQSSIAYHSQLLPIDTIKHPSQLMDNSIKSIIAKAEKSEAEIEFNDLYPTTSILVSTNWNKNDDVFDKSEVWAARNTPINKPTNLEHDEKQLVGHITNNWVISSDGKIISDIATANELPDLFHLCNSAVIYKNWSDAELMKRTDSLIQSIEAGEMFVSMECMFAAFDYAIVSPGGKFYTVARNNDSSFLTKHLRAYGGSGLYDGHKIGRLLRQLCFSGKGYVKKPANEHSVIFNDATIFEFSKSSQENPFIQSSGVYLNDISLQTKENKTMAEINADILKSQLDEVKTSLAKVEVENKELQNRLAKSNVEKYENQITDLTTQLQAAQQTLGEQKDKAQKSELDIEDLKAKLNASEEAKSELEAKITLAEKAKVEADRISLLVDGGFEREKAQEKVKTFSNLNDDQFKVLSEELISAVKLQANSDTEDSDSEKSGPSEENASVDEEQDTADANADSQVLENAEVDNKDIDGAAGTDETDEVHDRRMALAAFISSRLGRSFSDNESESS